MRILVTGGNGQVATALSHHFPKNWHTECLSHQTLDIGNKQSVNSAITHFLPDVIINTAAFTAVDEAEKNPDAAFYANGDAVFTLASLCDTKAIPLIHLSTDYLFDGNQCRPYQETDAINPLNIYGLSKWRGEEAIHKVCEAHIILRVSSVFSPYGKNFVKTILQLAKQKETLNIVADQTHCPTSARSIALALKKIIDNFSYETCGTYHYCNSPPTTWYDFCKSILSIGNRYQSLQTKNILPVSSAEFGALALRPRYSVLSCDKIKHFFDVPQLEWLEELGEIIEASI